MKLTGSPATDQSGTDCSHCSASVRCSYSRGAEETTRIIIGFALITTWFNTSATLEEKRKKEGEWGGGGKPWRTDFVYCITVARMWSSWTDFTYRLGYFTTRMPVTDSFHRRLRTPFLCPLIVILLCDIRRAVLSLRSLVCVLYSYRSNFIHLYLQRRTVTVHLF